MGKVVEQKVILKIEGAKAAASRNKGHFSAKQEHVAAARKNLVRYTNPAKCLFNDVVVELGKSAADAGIQSLILRGSVPHVSLPSDPGWQAKNGRKFDNVWLAENVVRFALEDQPVRIENEITIRQRD